MDSNTPQLIVALDVPEAAQIGPIVDALPDGVSFYKVGLELFIAEGPAALDPLRSRNKRIFLDLKLHDIPRTVAHAVRSASAMDVGLLTVHATGGRAMLEAAAEAAASAPNSPEIVAVTTLTSLNEDDFRDVGIQRNLTDQALALGTLALESGLGGVVTSVHEAGRLREALGPDALLVTPGIRPSGPAGDDQKRVATPATAVDQGSTHLVVGRPILQADDPHAAASAILDEISQASG